VTLLTSFGEQSIITQRREGESLVSRTTVFSIGHINESETQGVMDSGLALRAAPE